MPPFCRWHLLDTQWCPLWPKRRVRSRRGTMKRLCAISALAFSMLFISAGCTRSTQCPCVCQKEEPAPTIELGQMRPVVQRSPFTPEERAESRRMLNDITTSLGQIAGQFALIQAGAEQVQADLRASMRPVSADQPQTAAHEANTQKQGHKEHPQRASANVADAKKKNLVQQKKGPQPSGQVLMKEIWDGQGFTPQHVVVVKEGEGMSSVWRYVASATAHTSEIDATVLSILRVATTTPPQISPGPATSAGESEACQQRADAQSSRAPKKPHIALRAPAGFELTEELKKIEIGTKQIEEETQRIRQGITKITEQKPHMIQPAEVKKTAKQ